VRRRPVFAASVAVVLLLAAIAVAFGIGRFPIAPGDLAALVWAKIAGGAHGVSRGGFGARCAAGPPR